MVPFTSRGSQRAIRLLNTARVIFWDFDGVIKDSVEVKSKAFAQLFLPYGVEIAEKVRRHHEAHGGLSRYQKIPLYLSWAREPVTEPRIQEYCDRFSKLVMQAVIDSPWVPGVLEYLQARRTVQRFVLLTATPQEEILKIVAALNIVHCFDQICGAPTLKLAAMADNLRRLQCAPKDALMVGDAEPDLVAAQANEVPFLLRCTATNQTFQRRYAGLKFEDLVNE